MTKLILSVDPGGKGGETGVCIGRFGTDTPFELVEGIALPDGPRAFKKWWDLRAFRYDILLVEDFIQWKAYSDPTPLRLIGYMEAIFPDAILRPAGKKNIITDDQLKKINAYTPGGHHRDITEATRHAVAYLCKELKHKPTMEVLFPK